MTLNPPLVEVDRDSLQQKIAKASQILYAVAKAAYGPNAGNALLGFRHGPPMLSRDGVTNLKQVRDEDPIVDDIIQAIKEVSEKNNQKVGDGTTAVAILAHHLIMDSQRLEGKGVNPMEIARRLKYAETKAIEYIDSIKSPLGKDMHLEDIATIAAGDKELGAMISDIMKAVGKDGGVMIEQYEGLGVHNEIIDGFYFAKGYTDTALINDPTLNQSNHTDIPLLVASNVFKTNVDIGPVLESLKQAGISQIVMVADIQGEALDVLKLAKSKGYMLVVPVNIPYVAGGKDLFLDDIALMTGATVYDGANFDPKKHLGYAQEVLVTEYSTTVLGGDGDKDLIKERIKSLRTQVKELDHPQSIQFAKDRLARLTNKMAIIRVGGAIELERDETKLRVQDAVCAVQSAMKDGIVPGGGVALAHITGTDFDDAFKQPFKQLVENSGLNPELFVARLEGAGAWEGFDLKNVTDKPINLLDHGVIDASLVSKETVTNAVAIASGLITASVAIAHKVKE